ncbi:MAG: transpeptidase family protein [Taibaiella sp.]|nr:transpeptidase family protein [Taibaiella sp.]
MGIRRDIRFRVYIAFTGICVFGALIIYKAARIQVKEGKALIAGAVQKHTRIDTLRADRGSIFTEDGTLLSSSIPEFDVHIDFSVIDSALFAKRIDTLCLCLSRLFPSKSQGEFKEEFVRAYENEEGYYPLKRGFLKYYEYQQLKTFPIFSKSKNTGGLIAKSVDNREMPFNRLASRTIGTVKDTNSTGLEGVYNKYLRGVNGIQVAQKSARDIWIPIDGSETDPMNGKDIVTTIDIGIQDVADHVLRSVLEKYECQNGTCIVMEVKTGKIRALVNLGRKVDGTYDELLNYALIPTEPGSTFKVTTLLALLNDKYINVDNMVDAEGGSIKFNGKTMRDSHLGLRNMHIWEAYAHSSNAAMAKLATKYYKDNPSKYVKHLFDLKLDQPTGIDLPGEAEHRTVVRKPGDRHWSAITLPWMATGYSVSITPMHTCMLYNAVANNGDMMKPYLVSAIKEYGKNVIVIAPTVIAKVGDSSTVVQLQRCMKAVVTDGTAKGIQSPYYTMAGKTGTAQVAGGDVDYSDGQYQGSFVGYFPADAPKYTVCVVIKTKPHAAVYYGGAIAAPVFRMIADRIFAANMGSWEAPLDSLAKTGNGRLTAKMATARNYRNLLKTIKIPAVAPKEYYNELMQLTTDSSRHITIQPAKIYKDYVPDVKGMGLKDAVYILETAGMKVHVSGKGKVQSQSILPGTRIIKGENIILQLS